jgi:phage terminase large subunit
VSARSNVSSSTLRLETPRAFAPLLGRARYKGAYGGRGSGKSHFFAERLVEECVADHTTRAVCVREVQRSLSQSVKQLLVDKIARLGVGAYFEVLESEIHVLDDAGNRSGLILFQGMQNHTADTIKSLEGCRIAWVEEAQSLSQRSLELLTPTIRAPGSEIWFSWNPNKPTDPVDVFMRSEDSAGDPNIICVEVNYSDNPWFAQTELVADMERDRRRDPGKYAHVWKGDYSRNSEARVFRNWKVEAFDTPKDAVFRFGADWGFAVDPTVLVRCWLDGRTLYVDQEAWAVGCEIDKTPELFDRVEGSRKWTITADSARPETVSYMRRQGFKVVAAVKGPGSLEDGIEFLKSFDIVVHPRCKHVADELALYAYKTDPQTTEVLPVLEDKDNHTIDALRYALEALRRAGKKPDKEPEKPRDRYVRRQNTSQASWAGI